MPPRVARHEPAFVLFVVVEMLAFVWYLGMGRYAWFLGDEWDSLAARSAWNLGDLFRQHGDHWFTLPLLVFRLLWTTVGLRSYVPYVFVVVALHLMVAALLHRIMLRAGVSPWVSTVAASAFVLFGAGYVNIIYPVQIVFDGSLAFGLAQMLAADHDGGLTRSDWIGLSFGVAGLMCSAIVVPVTVGVGTAVLIRRGWRLALFHTVPLGVIYLVWLESLGNSAGYTRAASPFEVLKFSVRVAWATLVAIGGYAVPAVLLVAMLLGATLGLARTPERIGRPLALPIGLLAGAGAFLLFTGAGRGRPEISYFAQPPEASRYLHVTAALLIVPLAVAADFFVRRWQFVLAAVVPLLLLGIPSGVTDIIDHTYDVRLVSSAHRRAIEIVPRLPIATQVPRSTLVDPPFNLWLTVGWLIDGVESGRIPNPGRIDPDEVAHETFSLALRPLSTPLGETNCRRAAVGKVLDLRRARRAWRSTVWCSCVICRELGLRYQA